MTRPLGENLIERAVTTGERTKNREPNEYHRYLDLCLVFEEAEAPDLMHSLPVRSTCSLK